MYKKYFFIALLLCISTGAVHSQDTDITQKRKLIAEIFEVQMVGLSEKKLIERLEPFMRKQFEASLEAKAEHLSWQQRSRVTEVYARVMREDLSAYLERAVPNMMTAIENTYLRKFTTAELFELHRFITSDTGKKHSKITGEELAHLIEPVKQASAQVNQRIRIRLAVEFLKLESEGIRLKQP